MENVILNGLKAVTDLTPAGVEELVQSLGERKYRAKQVLSWLYGRLASSFDEMTDLPKEFREKLGEAARCRSLAPAQEVTGADGTVKTVFTLADGKTIESALMSYPNPGGKARHTVCVSTQVGCPVGCPFCATGQQGFERNLTPGEIIDQVLYFARWLREQDRGPVTNVVFMGMGEPLANFDALWQAIETLNAPAAFGLGARNMVVSTAGLVPGIERLGRQKLQVGLAVSLHAADNALRDRLVPLNRRYPLEQLIPACREYVRRTGRRVSFEYALFAGVNDGVVRARALAHLIQGMNCHINLIAANRTAAPDCQPPSLSAILAFENELKRLHIQCTLRQPRGQDIDAGCGQLRSRYLAAPGRKTKLLPRT